MLATVISCHEALRQKYINSSALLCVCETLSLALNEGHIRRFSVSGYKGQDVFFALVKEI
jgi:hypothetical protein